MAPSAAPNGPCKHVVAPHEAATMKITLAGVLDAANFTSLERPVQVKARWWREGEVPPADAIVVHFMRHGEGVHNVWGAEWAKAGKLGSPFTDPGCPEDAHLTPLGRSQAAVVLPVMQDHFSRATPEAPATVYVSPLRRTAETALAATEGLPVRYVAHEDLHERGGLYRCDRRLPTRELATQYPQVDYSLVQAAEDPLWGDGSAREPSAAVLRRAYAFLLWLRERPPAHGEHVLVVTHSSLLLHMFNGVLVCVDAPELQEWFCTGELRSVVLQF